MGRGESSCDRVRRESIREQRAKAGRGFTPFMLRKGLGGWGRRRLIGVVGDIIATHFEAEGWRLGLKRLSYVRKQRFARSFRAKRAAGGRHKQASNFAAHPLSLSHLKRLRNEERRSLPVIVHIYHIELDLLRV
jgi:hypothetical protein